MYRAGQPSIFDNSRQRRRDASTDPIFQITQSIADFRICQLAARRQRKKLVPRSSMTR
jgi:hypothetical protein